MLDKVDPNDVCVCCCIPNRLGAAAAAAATAAAATAVVAVGAVVAVNESVAASPAPLSEDEEVEDDDETEEDVVVGMGSIGGGANGLFIGTVPGTVAEVTVIAPLMTVLSAITLLAADGPFTIFLDIFSVPFAALLDDTGAWR